MIYNHLYAFESKHSCNRYVVEVKPNGIVVSHQCVASKSGKFVGNWANHGGWEGEHFRAWTKAGFEMLMELPDDL